MEDTLSLDQKSDEELVLMYQKGELEIGGYLIKRFYPLILHCSRHLFLTGAENEDLYQEGTVGLFQAFRDFNQSKNVKFSTFASLCIMRQQSKAIEASNRLKHSPLNNYLSIYDNSGDSVALIDTLASHEYDDPLKLFTEAESYKELLHRIKEELSSFENEVLDLYLKGLDYKTIASRLNKEDKSVDNAIQRIRSKVKKILNG